jgi:integrase
MARPVDLMRRSLPFVDWPDADRQAWLAAIAEGDVLDGCGPAAHWADITKETNRRLYGRWLGFLQWRGALAAVSSPADRATRDAIGAYNAHLAMLVAPRTRLSMLVGLKVTLQVVAPEQSWRWLQDVCNWVQRSAEPVRDKSVRLRPSGEIYAAALAELEGLAAAALDLESAIAFRDAFMLALLAARPIRVRNLTMIELAQHLVRVDDRWLLQFAAAETKTRQPIAFLLPDSLIPWLERYLAAVRLAFPGAATSQRLWLNRYGPATSPRFAYLRIVRLTRRLFGAPINPHLLRDCAATSLAMVSTDAARAAAPLLGHRHFSTTERWYVQADHLQASRRINAILAGVTDSPDEDES